MTQTKTKKALLMSVLSMVLCVAMLVGMTFAWFTDTASTSVNKIQAGNLDVQLLMRTTVDDNTTYKDISDASEAIFGPGSIAQNNNQETLWEPGKTQIAYLAVRNAGNLALKYNIMLNIVDDGLAGALQYVIVPQKTLTGENQSFTDTIGNWDDIKANAAPLPTGKVTAAPNGCLDEIAYDSTKINETEYFALVIHMDENAGNTYQEKNVTIDLKVVATQKDAEYDSNGNDYDKDVAYPVLDNEGMTEAITAGGDINVGTDVTTPDYFNIQNDSNIALSGNTWTVGDNTKLVDGANLKVFGGVVKSPTFASYIDVRPGSTADGVVEYTDVHFIGEYNQSRGTRGSSTTHTDYIMKYTPEAGGHAKLIFKNCTFENAAIQFSGLSGNDGTFEAVFEGCTFKGLTNSSLIEVKAYLTNSTITIKDCKFDVTATSNFSIIDGNYGRAATVNFEGSNSFTGVVATPTGADKKGTAEEIRIFSENLNVEACSAKTINGLDTVTVSGIVKK